MAKDQRITFAISKTKSGQMLVNMSFYPPPSKTKEEFEALPMYRREMQSAAADIGRYVMERLAQTEEQKKNGKIQRESASDKGSGETDGDLRQQPTGS